MTRDTKALQIARVEPCATVGDWFNMIDLIGAGAAFCTKRIRGQLPAAELLPGAVIAAFGGGQLPGRLLAPWSGISVDAAFVDQVRALN